MEIVELCECAHVAPRLAAWHVAEWADLYLKWDERAARAEFDAMDRPGAVPTTWVAFVGAERSAEHVLGSISLIDDDDVPGFRDRGPWLASLFIAPEARGRGLGTRLVEHLVHEARTMGLRHLYLFTAGQEPFYDRLGWRTIARPVVRGHETAVMTVDL